MTPPIISDFKISENAISWVFTGTPYQYPCSPESTALAFPSGQKILLVDRLDMQAPNNAVILSEKGEVINRIANPELESVCISYCLFLNGLPALVIAYKDRQSWGLVNENGEIYELHEWRITGCCFFTPTIQQGLRQQ